jgi:hypothetical protein
MGKRPVWLKDVHRAIEGRASRSLRCVARPYTARYVAYMKPELGLSLNVINGRSITISN